MGIPTLKVDVQRSLPGFKLNVRFTLNHDIMAVLEARFGPVPAALATQVEQLADLAGASAHFRRAVVVESLVAFAHELAATRLGPG